MGTQQKVEVLRGPDRLESWKEIAAYLRRSERTVRRWEDHEGLPVHRLQHDKRGSVYASARELDEWRDSRRSLVQGEPPTGHSTIPDHHRLVWRWWAAAAVGLAAGLAIWVSTRTAQPGYTPNPEAVRLVERAAVYGTNAGRVQIATGIRTYQEAIRLDPDYARAWGGLAVAHIALLWFGESPASELVGQARNEAREALRLDPSHGRAWRALAFASHFVDYDHATAETQFRRAIELDPEDAVALLWFGDLHADLGKLDEARRLYERAQHVSPRWLSPLTFAANLHYFSGHHGVAIAEYERVLAIEPSNGLGNHFLGRAHLAAGHHEEAVARLRKSDELLGQVPFSRADLGYALAVSGGRDEAEGMLAEMVRRRAEGHYPAFPLAVIHLGLGRTELALDWLETAVEERPVGFYFPTVDPFYDSVRTHPRFRRVLERLNVDF